MTGRGYGWLTRMGYNHRRRGGKMHDNQSQDTDDENDHNHIHGNKDDINKNIAKMRKTEHDEGAQYEEALDVE
eukprot:10071951-Ditylum_brightwellii.AAC.1